MMDYLNALRAKPIHVRRQITLVATTLLSAVVFGVWWNTWTAEENATTTLAEAATPSPWGALRDIVGHAKEDALAAFHETTSEIQYTAQKSTESLASTTEEGVPAPPEKDPGAQAESADAAGSKVAEASSTGEVLHTRPKSLETGGIGETTSSVMVQ